MSESVEPVQVRERRGVPAWVKILLTIVLLGGALGALALGGGASDAFVYSKKVDEVMRSPASFANRELRVEGDLKEHSILFRESPTATDECEWRFVLTKKQYEMPVRFPRCVVPDTFRDGQGLTVTVQGNLDPSGTFVASQVVPRCPSKYEMQERLNKGEAMPHASAAPAAIPATP